MKRIYFFRNRFLLLFICLPVMACGNVGGKNVPGAVALKPPLFIMQPLHNRPGEDVFAGETVAAVKGSSLPGMPGNRPANHFYGHPAPNFLTTQTLIK